MPGKWKTFTTPSPENTFYVDAKQGDDSNDGLSFSWLSRASDLKVWGEGDGGRFELLRMLSNQPGIVEFVRFKATLVEELVAGFRRVMTDSGDVSK